MKTNYAFALALSAALGLVSGSAAMAGSDTGRQGGHTMRGDTNGDGMLSRSEVEQAQSRLGQNFDLIDANKDGQLSRQEMREFRVQRMRQRMVERMQKFDQDFAAADTDRNGELSQQEAAASSFKGLDKQFASADVDGNGQISKNEARAAQMTGWHGRHRRGHFGKR